MKTVWAVMSAPAPVLGITHRIDLFDSEDKEKQFVDGILELSKAMESNLCVVPSHRDFSIVQMGVR